MAANAASPMELSIVMPCLNEADTIAACVARALHSLAVAGVAGEVIVADNDSTDDSAALAAAAGGRVVSVPARGYGNALMGGIEAARGRFILMGDADASYDFGAIEPFLARLREGWELVQGCRLPAGGGRVMPGAMPGLHRWVGNPLFTRLARWWFGSPVHDTNCGLRAFTKELYQRLDQRCTGMEFANEMLIKASLARARITEVPITLHRDGRKAHRPHLRTFRDGWRTLRFYLLFCPRWRFLVPGLGLMLLGLAGYALTGPARAGSLGLVVASLLLLCGYQSVLFAFLTKAFAINEGLLPMNRRMAAFFRVMTLERGLVAGAVALGLGLAGLGLAAGQPPARPEGVLPLAVPAATLATLGFQTVLFSFFASLLGMHRR
jgi:glycosyltransferase involved in cell wall biosynthesis